MEFTLLGKIFMGIAWTIIIVLTGYSFYKVFKPQKKD